MAMSSWWWHGRGSLTPLQLEFLALVAEGLSIRQICDRRSYARSTVKNALSRAYHAIGVTSRRGAIDWWRAHCERPVLVCPSCHASMRVSATIPETESVA